MPPLGGFVSTTAVSGARLVGTRDCGGLSPLSGRNILLLLELVLTLTFGPLGPLIMGSEHLPSNLGPLLLDRKVSYLVAF